MSLSLHIHSFPHLSLKHITNLCINHPETYPFLLVSKFDDSTIGERTKALITCTKLVLSFEEPSLLIVSQGTYQRSLQLPYTGVLVGIGRRVHMAN